MRIHYEQSGGIAFIPGLCEPVTIDTDNLPHEEAEALESLVSSARVFEEPRARKAAEVLSKQRDHRTYTIRVERGPQQRTLQFTDPIPAPLRPLVKALQTRMRGTKP